MERSVEVLQGETPATERRDAGIDGPSTLPTETFSAPDYDQFMASFPFLDTATDNALDTGHNVCKGENFEPRPLQGNLCRYVFILAHREVVETTEC